MGGATAGGAAASDAVRALRGEESAAGAVADAAATLGADSAWDPLVEVTPQTERPTTSSPAAAGPRRERRRALTVIDPSGLVVCSLRTALKL